MLRIDLVLRVLAQHHVARLIEVGPGMGAASWRMAQGRTYVGYEPDTQSYHAAVNRLEAVPDVTLINGMLPPTPDRLFDALVALEVLEHLEDDRAALEAWTEWVGPGGLVLLSVPAHQSRYGPMDAAVGHFRRYGRAELKALMAKAGLTEISIRSYGMPAGYCLEWVRNRLLAARVGSAGDPSAGTAASGRAFQPRVGSRLISGAMLPFRWAQIPFQNSNLGTGWVAWGTRGS